VGKLGKKSGKRATQELEGRPLLGGASGKREKLGVGGGLPSVGNTKYLPTAKEKPPNGKKRLNCLNPMGVLGSHKGDGKDPA